MWRRIMAAAVVAAAASVLGGCSGCEEQRRPVPETKRSAPGDFEGSGFRSEPPSEAPETPPADD
jgi:hypothetical protein